MRSFVSKFVRVGGLVLMLAIAGAAQATTYYISLSGSDSNSGTSTSSPWQTIAKVNATSFSPGSSILFNGGQTFTGNLSLTSSGASGSPITLGSYGSGDASINAGSGCAITCTDDGYITISNLNVYGSGASSNSAYGIYFNAGDANYSNITLSGCTVSAFGWGGIQIGRYNASYSFTNVNITSCTADNTGGHGIVIGHGNTVTVTSCTAYSNSGYSGIDLTGCNGGTVQHCICYNNGDVGMWCWNSNNIVFQYDTAYDNSGHDGGFDLDVATTNSTIQYCYSYGNSGEGYEVCSYPADAPDSNLTIRYNISENDDWPFAYCSASGGVTNGLYLYNNTIYNSNDTNPNYGLVNVWGPTPSPFICANNVIDYTNSGEPDLSLSNLPMTLNYDDYYGPFGAWFGGTHYTNMTSFESASGLEGNGLAVNPGFSGTPGTLNVNAYKLTSNSALLTTGANVESLYGINPGTQDYYGNPVPTNGPFSMGAYQSPAIISNGNHTLTPQNATGSRLDAAGGGTANGTAIDIWTANGGSNQTWKFTNLGGNVYEIQPSYDLSLALDVNMTTGYLDLWTAWYPNASNQEFIATLVSGNIYTFSPESATSDCMDVANGYTSNGTLIDIWTANGGSNQKWAVN